MKKELRILIRKLIQTDSQNPPGDERRIAAFIRGYLKKRNIRCRTYEFKKNRPNVVCTIKSRHSKKTILLTPHTDTVPAPDAWRYGAFRGTIRQGKIYGRGASDCKANVAVLLQTLSELAKHDTIFNNLDLVCAFCADEETGSRYGTLPLIEKLKNIDYGIVLDADEFDIVTAQKGLLHVRVEAFGKSAHGAFPHRGVNAIEQSVRALEELLRKGIGSRKHPSLKKPTLNIGRFWGGEKVNMVAANAVIELDLRYLPSQDKDTIVRYVKKIIERHLSKYRLTILAHQKPIEIEKNTPSIKILTNTLKKHRIRPHYKASFGATVINFLTDRGIEAFAFGFGSRGTAHSKDEYVRLVNLYKGVTVLRDYLIAFDADLGRYT